MRRLSSKFEGQSDNAQDSTSEFQFGPTENQNFESEMAAEFSDTNLSSESTSQPEESLPGDSLATQEGREEIGNLSSETTSQQNVERFNDRSRDEENQSSYVGDQNWAKKSDRPEVFAESQLIYMIVGSLALIGGGIALLARMHKKKNKKICRARAGRIDKRKEVRGAFKPVQGFKKRSTNPPAQVPEPPAITDDLAAQAGVSSLVAAQAEPIQLVPSSQHDGEFDFTGDLDQAGDERLESKELVEPGPASSQVFNDPGLLSARPSESSQERELAFVDSANLLDSYFIESTPAHFAFSQLEYSFHGAPHFSGGESASLGEDKDLDEDSKQDTKNIFPNDKQASEMAANSDPELEQEANEFARNFFTDESDNHPVPAINEDEEAVMNSKNDDSDLEFDFDLDDAVEINDSDADFNFDLEVEEGSEEPLAELAVADIEASSQADDDSAEFVAMFDEDSSEDLAGLELNAPVDSADEVVAVADDADIELKDLDLDLEELESDVADEVTAHADELDIDIDLADDLDGSIELAGEEVEVPEIGTEAGAKIGDAVESLGESVGEKVDAVVDQAAETVGGLSDSAKTAAVAAGAAGTAAGGGFLAKIFGWGKKKKAAQETIEDAIDEVEMDDVSVAESDVISEAVSDTEIAVDFDANSEELELGIDSENGEVEFDLGGESESDEFDFSLDDDDGPEVLADQEIVSEIEVADDEFAAVPVEAKQVDDSSDSSIDLLDESGEEFDLDLDDDLGDFAELDSAEAANEQSFSSRKTLREPVPDPVKAKSGFSSADTLREPISSEPEISAETEPDGLGIAAAIGGAAAGAAALVGLNKGDAEQASDELQEIASTEGISQSVTASESPNDELIAKIKELETANSNLEKSAKSLEEKLAAKEKELVEAADGNSTAEADQEELVAKVKELEQSNKALNESAQLLEEKLEAQTDEAQNALAKAEKDYEAKLEESATGQSKKAAELESQLESLKVELEEAKSSATQIASQAAEEKESELEKLQTDLETAQSSSESLKQEIESLKLKLADATVAAADDDDGMPSSSLMGAVGLGAAGLMGGKSLLDKSADSEATSSPVDDDLKKRFQKRLQAERQARKDAESHLEQAELQRNDVAKTLRGVRKELVEAQKAATDKSPAKDNSSLQLKALESQLERQSDKMKALGEEKEKLSAELKTAQDSIESLNAENSKLKKKVK